MTPLLVGAVLIFKATAYSLTCDAPGPHTKAGTTPVAGHTIAADPRVLPIGSIVEIEGLGQRQVHDVGGGVRGRHVDVYFDTCAEARRWGIRRRVVRVLHVPTVSAQAPRRSPDSPGGGRLSRGRSALLTVAREEGQSRRLVSQTSRPGRAAPAARSLGGDWRERYVVEALLIGALVGTALGIVVIICALWMDAAAWALACGRVGRWWSLVVERGLGR